MKGRPEEHSDFVCALSRVDFGNLGLAVIRQTSSTNVRLRVITSKANSVQTCLSGRILIWPNEQWPSTGDLKYIDIRFNDRYLSKYLALEETYGLYVVVYSSCHTWNKDFNQYTDRKMRYGRNDNLLESRRHFIKEYRTPTTLSDWKQLKWSTARDDVLFFFIWCRDGNLSFANSCKCAPDSAKWHLTRQ